MQTDETRPFVSNGCRQTHRNPATVSPSTVDGSDTLVLADAIAADRFHDGACVAICPGCGDRIDEFPAGLPDPFVRFREPCEPCDVSLRPWATVVAPLGCVPSLEEVQDCVQAFWERRFRVGVEDPAQFPYTREFTTAVQRLADVWGWDWEVTCPLCARPLSELATDYLGYHHWQQDPDIGTSLCRTCHDYLHGVDPNGAPPSQPAKQQNWRAKQLGLGDFRDLAVIRLALRDRHVHEPGHDEDDPAYARRLRRRYNVPLPPARITKLVAEVRNESNVRHAIVDYGGSPAPDLDLDSLL